MSVCIPLLMAAVPFAATAQEPAEQADPQPLAAGMVATWNGGRIEAEVFERWLGMTSTVPEFHDEALRHLIQLHFIRRVAAMNGVEVSDRDTEARIAELEAALAGSEYSLDEVLAERLMDRDEFREFIRSSLEHERLVRLTLGLPEGAAVTAPQLNAWTAEHLPEEAIQALLEASKEAPTGMALDSGDFRIGVAEVGLTLRRIVPSERLRSYLEQMALQDALPRWAAAQGLVMTDDILYQEIEWRRAFVARSPESFGATYEMILETRGMTVEDVFRSEELRAAGYLRVYAEHRYPDAWFDALDDVRRAELERQHGATRQTAWILLRAVENPDELDLGFEQAAEQLRELAAQAGDDHKVFLELAAQYSDDELSRRRDGVIGWLHHVEPRTDPAVCAAAFATPVGTISEPLRVAGGMALVMPLLEQGAPGEAGFRSAVRRSMHIPLRDEFLHSIELRTVYDEGP